MTVVPAAEFSAMLSRETTGGDVTREELLEIADQLTVDYDDAEEALEHQRATIRRLSAELRALRGQQ